MTEIMIQEEWLECAICMERLDENCKMLPCQHTYCKQCLERMYEREGSLICAQCRKIVSNPTGGNPIDALPTNLVLLSLIEQVKRSNRRPQNEGDEFQTAITNSIEDFHKEKHADMLLKHNEQLQIQLAMESSKRDVLLKSAQDMSEELNELFLSQRFRDEEVHRRENQNLLSEKKKLEIEMAILKSEQESPSYVTELISWFETNYTEFNRELKSEAQNALNNLRRAKVTQKNDSIQRRLRTLLENLSSEENSKTLEDNVDIIDELNKKLNEVKVLLKNESQARKLYTKSEKNYLTQSHQSRPTHQLHSSYNGHPSYHHYPISNYYPPLAPLLPFPAKPHQFIPNVYPPSPYCLPPNTTPYYPPASNYPPGQPCGPFPRLNYSESSYSGFGGKCGTGSRYSRRPAFPNNAKNFNEFNCSKVDGSDNHSKSLILPDVRDYDRYEGKTEVENSDKLGDEKIRGKANRLPSSSCGEVGGSLLMLPDVRYYENLYSKSTQCSSLNITTGNGKNDTESFRAHHANKKKKSFDDSCKSTKSCSGRGKNRCRSTSKSMLEFSGFESDASVDSTTSVSSKLSTCSSPTVFHEKKHSFYRDKNRSFHRTRGSGNRQLSSADPLEGKFNKTESDGLKQLLYPPKEEARKKNLNVKRRFDSPLLCLAKNGVSKKVDCLADIYAFEEKYKEIKVIHY